MKNYLKYFFLIILFFFSFFSFTNIVEAKEPVNIYLFYSETCPHCHEERIFLKQLKSDYGSDIKVFEYDVFSGQEVEDLLKATSQIYHQNLNAVPVTVIGDQLIIGYADSVSTGTQIKRLVDLCLASECNDSLETYKSSLQDKEPVVEKKFSNIDIPETLNLPLFGEIQTKHVSLPFLTFVIAAVDGFNPCAMWVLVFLITLLLSIKNRRRMWLLGITFILASGFVYFVFLAAWLNLILFIGLIFTLRLIIGLVAITAGSYNLREYWINRPGCKVTESEKRRKIFEKLKEITESKSLWWSIIGITLIAFAVNLVEVVCSAGLPAIYTSVLALTEMSRWQYYMYLLFYIFIFMLDDMLVFIIAMITLKTVGVSGKYTRFSHLIGGLIILMLGLLLIFRPELLMFN